jgi:hypothetical protein
MKFVNAFIFFTICSFVYSQSKKEQIENLSIRVDSLIEVLNFEKKSNKIQNETLILKLDSLRGLITNEKQSNLNNSTAISELNSNNKSINSELSKLNQELSLIKLKNDSLNVMRSELEKLKIQMNPEKKDVIKKTYTPITFWNIKIGESDYNTVSEYLKLKKRQGVFNKLISGTSVFSDKKSILAQGKTKLDNILTYESEQIKIIFDENNVCNRIDIQYDFRNSEPNDLFNKLIEDMERYLKVKATLKIEEDINSDKTQIATLKKDGITIKIRNEIASDFAPDVAIYCD